MEILKYKYKKTVLKYSTLVNVLSYFPPVTLGIQDVTEELHLHLHTEGCSDSMIMHWWSQVQRARPILTTLLILQRVN